MRKVSQNGTDIIMRSAFRIGVSIALFQKLWRDCVKVHSNSIGNNHFNIEIEFGESTTINYENVITAVAGRFVYS